jgi:hypothetical protein
MTRRAPWVLQSDLVMTRFSSLTPMHSDALTGMHGLSNVRETNPQALNQKARGEAIADVDLLFSALETYAVTPQFGRRSRKKCRKWCASGLALVFFLNSYN